VGECTKCTDYEHFVVLEEMPDLAAPEIHPLVVVLVAFAALVLIRKR